MRKLALSDEILMHVDKAARYIGGEINSVHKDPDKVDIHMAMCFPDVYEIGMSHLGIQILYDMFNRREDVFCERVYSPWTDLHKIMKEQHIPLFGLESQTPLYSFDLIGITIQYEMCYSNLLQLIDLSGIPIFSADRSDTDPLVIGGGPCTYNPEPIADFFDLFYIGEGEVTFDLLFDLYKSMKKNGFTRKSFLHEAAKIPGIYVPSLYAPSYHQDGTLADFTPLYPDIPTKIKRQVVRDFDSAPYSIHPVIPYVKATQDRVVLEIQRGCIRGCRFCQAGMVYRPNREKSLDVLKRQADEMLRSTGHEEISLSSLSSSDYEKLPELMEYLLAECRPRGINISLPSMRIDAFSVDIMKRLSDIKKSSVTFAPEAGSARMRNVINKGLTEEDIENGSKLAFLGGFRKVKFYFMLGLPEEEKEDIRAIPELCNRIAALYYDTVPKEKRNGKCQITISTSFFVPKPFTPFQWAAMLPPKEYLNRAKLVNDTMKEQLNHKSLVYHWHDADTTMLEGIFARGDRRLSPVIYDAYKKGAIFDAWQETFDYDLWMSCFADHGIDPDFYTLRPRSSDELFPWDFIDTGISKKFLHSEWEKAKEQQITQNCRAGCSGCGCSQFQTGVCQ